MERHFMGANTEAAASAKSEIDRYLCEPQEPFHKQYDSLKFWKHNQQKYPILCTIAKDYLSIQPTSVPSERAFSQGGLTVTRIRNRLTPDTVKKMMSLKSWLKVVDK